MSATGEPPAVIEEELIEESELQTGRLAEDSMVVGRPTDNGRASDASESSDDSGGSESGEPADDSIRTLSTKSTGERTLGTPVGDGRV